MAKSGDTQVVRQNPESAQTATPEAPRGALLRPTLLDSVVAAFRRETPYQELCRAPERTFPGVGGTRQRQR